MIVDKSKLSPMMQNYWTTKEQYQDCILLYRLGDFYEMFFDDAEKASRILDLTLTGKNCGLPERAPMCGVPYHAVEIYVGKLIAAGCKVAICEQLSEPNGKELVDRAVVRVITPGTVMDTGILDEARSNYIASVCASGVDSIGVAVCDISTGDFFATELKGLGAIKDLQEVLVSYKPAEIIANSQAVAISSELDCVRAQYTPTFSSYDEIHFDKKRAKQVLENHYHVATTDGFGLQGKACAISACGALLDYAIETQKRPLDHLKNISYVDKTKYMSIDVKTRKNLELTVSGRENKKRGSLLWLLDKTQTAMGARMLSDWIDRPLQKPSAINARLDGVEELYTNYMLRAELDKLLHNVFDIERIAGKIAYNNVAPKDCITLKNSLYVLPAIKRLLSVCSSKIVAGINESIDPLTDVYSLIDRAIVDDVPVVIKDNDFIKKGYNAELDELFDISQNGSTRISALEETERIRTGIKTLKTGYNKVFGYYFEISNSFLPMVPDTFIRKQTLVNGERFVSPELKELEEKMLSAQESKIRLQKRLFEDIRTKLLE